MSSRRRELEQLERGLQSKGHLSCLRRMAAREPALARFEEWRQVVICLRAYLRNGDQTDVLLRPLVTEWRGSGEPVLGDVLLAAFGPTLVAIDWQKRRWEWDRDERWQKILCAFLQSLRRVNPAASSRGLAFCIRNRTIHYFHDQVRAGLRSIARETAVPTEVLRAVAPATPCTRQAEVDAVDERAAAQKVLSAHYRAGALGRDDFLLLSATRVLGQSVAEYARHHNLDYQAVKKRRQRVEAALARLQTKNLSSLCPRDPRRGALS